MTSRCPPPRRILALRREWLEQWIEAAIELLDRIDGDPDLEAPADDEDEELAA